MGYNSIFAEGFFGEGALADVMEQAFDMCIFEEMEKETGSWNDADDGNEW